MDAYGLRHRFDSEAYPQGQPKHRASLTRLLQAVDGGGDERLLASSEASSERATADLHGARSWTPPPHLGIAVVLAVALVPLR